MQELDVESAQALSRPDESRPQTKTERPRGPRLRAPRRTSLLPLVGLVPAVAFAALSLTEPWARARVLLMWGVSRSPGAQVLVICAIAGAVAASVVLAGRGRRRLLAAAVHLATGVLLCGISWIAFSMVRHAGVRALGLLPLAAVHPGPGLRHFLLASLLVVALGLVELAVALVVGVRSRRRSAP